MSDWLGLKPNGWDECCMLTIRYNAMILPYAEGPMALTGVTWYQGEANTANATTAEQYGCLFPQVGFSRGQLD